MDIDRFIKRGVLVAVLFFLAISIVNAFGVSAPYIDGNAIKILPGKQYEYTVTVQNGDDEDYYVDIVYSPQEIARLDNSSQFIKSKTYDTNFVFHISVPENTTAGTKYTLEYTARPRVNDTSDVTMAVEIKRSVDVIVTDDQGNIPLALDKIAEAKKESMQTAIKYLIIAAGIIVALLVAFRLWKLSKGLSEKIGSGQSKSHTISDSKNSSELYSVVKKMSDEEFGLHVIKAKIKDRIAEFSPNTDTPRVDQLTKKRTLSILKKMK